MRISVLCEDSPLCSRFEAEHGLSFLIQTETHKILFDAGQSDLFLRNAEKLGETLQDVDIVILSHGHYDHGNGLEYFMQRNSHAKIYCHPLALGDFFHGERYIGLSENVKAAQERFVWLGKETAFDEEISVIPASCFPEAMPNDLQEKREDRLVSDRFDHELYLVVKQNNRKVLFTGCCHRGILSVLEAVIPKGITHVVGGLHLTEVISEEGLEKIANKLQASSIECYSGHCTCAKAAERLSTVLGKRYHKIASGMMFAIGGKAELAATLFRQGYNCSQAVLGAFAEELGLPFEIVAKLSCSFGGGMGRMREVCGAVSGMLLICGMTKGYSTPETGVVKAEHYRLVQELAKCFKERYGSIYCHDLLGGTASTLPTPTERNYSFYSCRPCEKLIASAASILEEILFQQ